MTKPTRLLLERDAQGGAQAIPPTLQQSLAARLNRLGEAREVGASRKRTESWMTPRLGRRGSTWLRAYSAAMKEVGNAGRQEVGEIAEALEIMAIRTEGQSFLTGNWSRAKSPQ